jgi:hypothetical protein
MIGSNIAVNIKALQVCAQLPSGRYFNRCVGYRALEADTKLLRGLSFDLTDLLAFAIFLEECDSPLQAELRALNTICLDKVNNVMWLHDFDEKDGANLSRVIKVPLMVPLFLHDLNPVLAALDQCSDVQDLILPLFLIIRRIWDAELL